MIEPADRLSMIVLLRAKICENFVSLCFEATLKYTELSFFLDFVEGVCKQVVVE